MALCGDRRLVLRGCFEIGAMLARVFGDKAHGSVIEGIISITDFKKVKTRNLTVVNDTCCKFAIVAFSTSTVSWSARS